MPTQKQQPQSDEPRTPHAPAVEVVPGDDEEANAAITVASADTADEMAEYQAFLRWKAAKVAQGASKTVSDVVTGNPVRVREPDPYEPDDEVTLLLPVVYRAVIEGREAKNHRVFIGAERPGLLNEDTGRPGPGIAVTLTFTGGVCRDVPYGLVKALKKSRAYRSNDSLKVVANDTPEAMFAKLCGVQPMQPSKQAAMLLASDLDAVLAEFDTEQLKVFTEALKRRAQGQRSGQASQTAQDAPRGDILNSQSFRRG